MVTFTKPEDYEIPEGAEDDEFEEVATFKVDEDGKLQIIAIDGNLLMDDEDKKKKKKPKGAIEQANEDFDPAAQSTT